MKRLVLAGILTASAFFTCYSDAGEAIPEAAPRLKILIAAVDNGRGDDFEAYLKKHQFAVSRATFKELTKEKVKDFDVILIDPEPGATGGNSRDVKVAGDLGKPIIAIGAPGSYALIPVELKFGNNG